MVTAERVMSIPSFCKAYGISVATYYRMQRAGMGPRVAKLMGRRMIVTETAEAWLREREGCLSGAAHGSMPVQIARAPLGEVLAAALASPAVPGHLDTIRDGKNY